MQFFDELLIAQMFLLVENGVARKHTNHNHLSGMLSRQFFLGLELGQAAFNLEPYTASCCFSMDVW